MDRKQKWGMVAVASAVAASVSSVAWAAPGVRGRDAIEAIFGVDAETLASAIRTAGESNSILATVAGVVNLAALLAAVVIILLTFVSAVLQQGEHGKVGGRFSAVWVPLRAVFAGVMLMPLSLGGYSVVQAGVLWLGMQGSGFADDAWARSNQYLSQNLQLSRAVPPRDTSDIVAKLYAMEMCAAAVEAASAGDGSGMSTGSFGVDVPDAFTTIEAETSWAPWRADRARQHVLQYNGSGDLSTVSNLCGAVTVREVPVVGSTPEANFQRELEASIAGFSQAEVIAVRNAVRAVVAGRLSGELDGDAVRVGLLDASIRHARLRERRTLFVNASSRDLELILRDQQQRRASEQGWMLAGSYYMTFAAFDGAMSQRVFREPEIEMPRLDQLPASIAADVDPWVSSAFAMAPRPASTGARDGASSGAPGAGISRSMLAGAAGLPGAIAADLMNGKDEIERAMNDAAVASFRGFTTVAIGQDGMVMPRLIKHGHSLLNFAGWVLAAMAGVGLIAGLASGGLAIPLLLMKAIPLIVVLVAAGAGLAYLLPALPFLIWVAGVAGWLLMLTQAVVAAPLWAAAHTAPDGEGFAGRHAMNGYMLLVSLVARPILMLAGLLAGMLIFDFMARFLLMGFDTLITSEAADVPRAGFVGMVVWVLLFSTMLLVLARWSFSLIELIPNAVLRFIGAASEALGETGMAEQARTMALAAWATTRGMGGRVGDAVGGVARQLGERGRAKNNGVVGRNPG